jgi:hypothetical protein
VSRLTAPRYGFAFCVVFSAIMAACGGDEAERFQTAEIIATAPGVWERVDEGEQVLIEWDQDPGRVRVMNSTHGGTPTLSGAGRERVWTADSRELMVEWDDGGEQTFTFTDFHLTQGDAGDVGDWFTDLILDLDLNETVVELVGLTDYIGQEMEVPPAWTEIRIRFSDEIGEIVAFTAYRGIEDDVTVDATYVIEGPDLVIEFPGGLEADTWYSFSGTVVHVSAGTGRFNQSIMTADE